MCAAIDSVKTGQVTYAVRDTEMENKIIKEGDILGLYNGKIAASGQDIDETAFELLQDMYDEKENDLITVYYGQDVSEEQAEKLRERLEEQFDGADVELHNGGQPFIIIFFRLNERFEAISSTLKIQLSFYKY